MPLVQSTVYEVMRLEPPVPYQYGRAKENFVLESHDGCFKVRKGELLGGYQPFASRDPKVFVDDPEEFMPHRFMGEKGQNLLRFVVWSNGPETESPTVSNKQCAGMKKMERRRFDRRLENEGDLLFIRIKVLNGERSRLAQAHLLVEILEEGFFWQWTEVIKVVLE